MLPAILAVMIEHGVNLKSRAHDDKQVLSCAILHRRVNTINFLLEQKIEINDPCDPPLACAVDILGGSEKEKLDLVKRLIKSGATNSIEYKYHGTTALVHAINNSYPTIVTYLLSLGANIFAVDVIPLEGYVVTALGVAYKRHTDSRFFIDSNELTKSRQCLELLTKAAIEYLYNDTMRRKEEQTQHLNFLIDQLAGNFKSYDSNSEQLKSYLNEYVLKPVLKRINPAPISHPIADPHVTAKESSFFKPEPLPDSDKIGLCVFEEWTPSPPSF